MGYELIMFENEKKATKIKLNNLKNKKIKVMVKT